MKQEWISWFIENLSNKDLTLIQKEDRQYQFYNFGRHEVPFDSEILEYVKKVVGMDDITYDCYHTHVWNEGDFFDTHTDNRFGRIFSFVCELQQSDCKTKLLVEDQKVDEGWFDVLTEHRVPKIKKGQRISLTIFGKKTKSIF